MASENQNTDDKDFQGMWKIASTAQFVKAFQELFKLPEIEIENFEEGLLNKSMYGIHVMKSLVVALLRGIYPTGGVRLDNYESSLRKIVSKIWILENREEENPLKGNANFEDLEPLLKLDIIYSLCLRRLDKASDLRSKHKDHISKMNGDSLRVQPVGCDDEGNEYWYIYGTRLYKQAPSKDRKIKDWEEEWNTQKNTSLVKRGRGRPRKIKPRKSDGESDESKESPTNKSRLMDLGEKSRWSLVCNTLDDWVEFAEKFKDSKSKVEKALFRTITDDYLPVINEAYQAKERKLQQKLLELIPTPTIARMETRQRTKSTSDSYGDDDDESRGYSTSNREQRLEERNRRLNQSAENGSRRRSRSRISYDENYDDFDDELSRSRNRLSYVDDDEDFGKATGKKSRKRLSFVENDMEDFVEATSEISRNRELIEAKANEILKDYVSLASKGNNKSQIMQVFTQVKLDKNSYPFHYKVDKEDFPDYYDIISEPMDLGRIERKLRLKIYKTAAEVDDDFKKMVENCRLYFGADSERSKMGTYTWMLFRRLMAHASQKQRERNTAVLNGTGENENQNLHKNKKSPKVNSERSEHTKKKRKHINIEALDILSKEAELAVERSQSLDEEHFRNFTQKTKKLTKFSDLIVEPIHSHPSDLIQKFMSDSSSHGSEDSYSEEPPAENQNSDNPCSGQQSSPENMEVNDYHDSNEGNSNSSLFMDKNDPKSFNILSSDNEANLEILSVNEMYPHSLSNSLSTDFDANGNKKCSDDALINISDKSSSNNLVSNSSNLGSSPINSSFESYHSPNSSSPGSSPKDSANDSPHHIENNTTFLNGYEYASFTQDNESNGSSTVDASCLGLASDRVYKKRQLENEPKTSDERFSQSTSNCNGNQNSYNGFSKLNVRTQELSRNQPKIRPSNSDDQMMEDRFSQQEISRGKPNSTVQAMDVSLVNQEPSKSPPAYSSLSSYQIIQGQMENPGFSITHFQHSALSPEQEVHLKLQDLEQSPRQPRCSPPILSNEKVQGQGSTESQPSCSPVLSTRQEINGVDHSRNHQSFSPSDNFTSLQGQRMQEQEFINGQRQHFPSQQGIESHDSAKNHQRSSPTISFSQEMHRQISSNDQTRSPTYNTHQEMASPLISNHEMQGSEMAKSSYYTQASSYPPAALENQDSAESQQRHSLNPSPDETQKQRPVKPQVKSSNISSQNKQVSDEVENGKNNTSQPMGSAVLCAEEQLKNQNPPKNYSMYWDQNFTGNQPRYSPTLPAHLEINNPQPVKIQVRYSPTVSVHQEMNHQQPAINQPRYSPTVSVHQGMNHQQTAVNQPRYSPTLSAHQEMNHQQATVNQPRYSPTVSAHQEMNHHQTAENKPGCLPKASAQQTDDKKSATIKGNSPFSTSQIVEQESVQVQSGYSPAFSNQRVLIQDSAKGSVQHMHTEAPSMHNQVPIEAPPFDFGNIFSNSVNAPAQANEPPFTANSQVPVSHFNPSHMTRPSFPTVNLRLPASSGELIVVPGDPSSMTFHLFAKPLSDPSQPIQSSMEIHASNQMRNQACQDNSTDEPPSAPNKKPAKQDTTRAPRKQISPILDLEQLALNPRRSSPPSSSQKNKSSDNISHSNRSAEPSLKSPPAITSDFSVVKPNAVLVRPLEYNASPVQQQSRNNNSFQQSAFVQQTEGPRTVIFPKGNRMTNGLGSSSISTNSVSAMSMNVNSQRHIIPNTLPNTVMQNGSGQYVFVPSLQSNVDQNFKVKNSERPPQFYPSNMMQCFPFQNGQMTPVQMLPQVHLPYANPYYIVTNPSAFQNASRYPVMNMQQIPFQNR